jgi:hypothetical protein
MTKQQLLNEARRFRKAIETAKEAGMFLPKNHIRQERMNNFPLDCCDDTADLFTHYLYHEFSIYSIRVDAKYYDNRLRCTCGHSWQETEGFIIDMTGDQFNNDPSLPIKANPVYVGKMDSFHRQFEIIRQEPSCGIESLGDSCRNRMNNLYDSIMAYI